MLSEAVAFFPSDDFVQLSVLPARFLTVMKFAVAIRADSRDVHWMVRAAVCQSSDVVHLKKVCAIGLLKGSWFFTPFTDSFCAIQSVSDDDGAAPKDGHIPGTPLWIFICCLIREVTQVWLVAVMFNRLLENHLPQLLLPAKKKHDLTAVQLPFFIEHPFPPIDESLTLPDKELEAVSVSDVTSHHVIVVAVRIAPPWALTIEAIAPICQQSVAVAVHATPRWIADQDDEVVFAAAINSPLIVRVEVGSNGHPIGIDRTNFDPEHLKPLLLALGAVSHATGCTAVKEIS